MANDSMRVPDNGASPSARRARSVRARPGRLRAVRVYARAPRGRWSCTTCYRAGVSRSRLSGFREADAGPPCGRAADRTRPRHADISPISVVAKIVFRPQIRREYPLDLSILISGGKENNRDSPSSGERTGKSPSPNPAAHFCAAARMGVVAYGPASLPGRTRRSKSPLNGAMARRWCQASRAVVTSRDRTAPSSLVA